MYIREDDDMPRRPPTRAGGDTPKIPSRIENPRKFDFDPDLQRTAAPSRGELKRRSSISGIERRMRPLTPPRRVTSTIDFDTVRTVLLQVEPLLDVESESAQAKTDTFDAFKEPENDGSEKSRQDSYIKASKKHSRRGKSYLPSPRLRAPWRSVDLSAEVRLKKSADKAQAEEAVL
jgi:hypothetical protein